MDFTLDEEQVEAGVAAWLERPAIHPGDALRLPGRGETFQVVGVLAPRSTRTISGPER